MRAQLTESVQLMEQREMNTNIECVILFASFFPSCLMCSSNLALSKLALLTTGAPRYEQLTLRANSLREELHTEIERMLNDTIKFKVHIQKNLEDYEGFVADELEKELGSDEMKDDNTQRGLDM